MSVLRRFHAPGAAAGAEVRLEEAESHYLLRVLRLEPGVEVEVFDGVGRAYAARFLAADGRGRCRLAVDAEVPSREPGRRLTLAVAPPKGDGLTRVARQLAELGASRLIPLITERTSDGRRRPARWREAALSGTRQCGRARIPRVERPVAFADFLAAPLPPVRRIASLTPLPGVRQSGQSPPAGDGRDLVVAIGPEGGFAPGELAAARDRGFVRLDLGERVLRTATAAVIAAARLLEAAEEA